MSDITLQKAASKAYQAEIVARMLENYPHKLTDSDVESVGPTQTWNLSPHFWLI